MKIIIYLLLIIIILSLIYHVIYNSQEPFGKKLKKLKKKAKNISKPVVNPINKTIVAPAVAQTQKHIVKPALEVVKDSKNAFENIKDAVQKNIITPIKVIIHPPRPPPKPIRPYEYKFHSNIPKEYRHEIFTTFEEDFKEVKPMERNFVTKNKTHKCVFKHNPKVNDVKFVRTIINPDYNFDFTIDTTSCGPNVPEDKCNKNKSYDMKSVFIEEKPNKYINYELDKNKVFLHYKDEEIEEGEEGGDGERIKTFKDYNNVAYEDISPIYSTKYNVCQPSDNKFNIVDGFDKNFPCSVVVCDELSENEKQNIDEINYDNLNDIAKKYHDDILRYEHQGAIDKVLQSVGFKAWINILNQNQKTNTNIINEYENYDDSKIILD